MNCFKIKKKDKKNNFDGDSKNIYLNLKKKQLNEINQINDALKSLNYQKIILLKDIESLKEKKKADESDFCNIWFSRKKDICLVPCGHLFCQECTRNIQKCYFCRKDIKIKQKIYLN